VGGANGDAGDERTTVDTLLTSTWRLEGLARFARGGGGAVVAEAERTPEPRYVWRQGRIEVIVERRGEHWHVHSSTSGRLFGPRETIYEAQHKLAKHAAWDVMACVIRASRNEDEGVNEGRKAARWMIERRLAE
jgi:hypothetical protein